MVTVRNDSCPMQFHVIYADCPLSDAMLSGTVQQACTAAADDICSKHGRQTGCGGLHDSESSCADLTANTCS